MRVCVYVCVYVYMCIYINTHTHTNTCVYRSQLLGLGLAKAATVHGDTPLHFMAQLAEEASFRPVSV